LLSAASVLNAIDRKKYDVVPIGISKQGKWLVAGHAERLLSGGKSPDDVAARHLRAGDPEATEGAAVLARGEAVIVPPMPAADSSQSLVPFQSAAGESPASTQSPRAIDVDIIFPVLHGTFGEDGTIQ